MKSLRNLRLTAVVALAVMALGGGIASSAVAVEPTTGQPGAGDEHHCGEPGLVAPGKSELANSVFNEHGVAPEHYAGNPGTASLEHAASTAAVSQYDVACLNQSLH
jgi:hypothetical protein